MHEMFPDKPRDKMEDSSNEPAVKLLANREDYINLYKESTKLAN